VADTNIKKRYPQNSKTVVKNRIRRIPAGIPGWAVYAVIAYAFVLYFRSLFNNFVILDDNIYLFNNPLITEFSFSSVRKIFSCFYDFNYFPLNLLTYLFEYHVYGLNPLPYHALNLFLHLVNTFLAFKLAERLSGNRLTAIIVSLLFGIHPMHVESVAWASERKDVLYSVFFLGALLLYVKYIGPDSKKKNYWLCLVLFVFSLLSKSAAVTLPLLMIAVDVYKGRKFNTKLFIEKLPFFALSLLFGILALLSQQQAMRDLSLSVSYSFIDKIFLFTYTLSFYIIKLFIPFGLSGIHYYPVLEGGMLPWTYYLSLPFILALVWLVIKRTKFQKEKVFGVFFFLIAISIMLQLIPIGYAITAERYSYISYIGLFYFIGQWITGIEKVSLRKNVLIVTGAVILIFSFHSWERIGIWKDADVFFTDIINKYPDRAVNAYSNRSVIRSDKGDIDGALNDINAAIRIDSNDAEKYLNRGAFKLMKSDYEGSLEDFDRSIKLKADNKDAYSNRAYSRFYLKDTAGACEDWYKASELGDESAEKYIIQFCLHKK
jgi:protein O-mannosyl-transferase